ncbi:hypothetical protein CVIRNUC_005324 [Coccomyxa viridis]|uniref:Sulfite exporter TauE/SafE n=1 Tax=Coccomyxa viridis TaxID=1274662 RepID=A0AAV1I445_9CHLO|nr:hypothetical protein CVIRNUC_005324 [Coccomyxa viridis]
MPLKSSTDGVSTLYSSQLYNCWTRLSGYAPDPHKPLFPLTRADWIGYGFAAISLFIAAGGGIGGGGILVPLYILLLGFNTDTAVALSNITIVGGAISNFLFNVGRRHAYFDKPLIDWELILVMEPTTILGALLGGYLNKAIPNWLTTVLLAILLTMLTWKLTCRGFLTWRKETADAQQQCDSEAAQPLLQDGQRDPSAHSHEALNEAFRSNGMSHPIECKPSGRMSVGSVPFSLGSLGNEGAESPGVERSFRAGSHHRRVSLKERISARNSELENTRDSALPVLDTMDEQTTLRTTSAGAEQGSMQPNGQPKSAAGAPEKVSQLRDFGHEPQVPPLKLGILVFMFLCVVASDLGKEHTRCGTWQYWLVVFSILPVILGITFLVREHLVRQYEKRVAAGYEWTEGEVEWTPRNTIVYPLICSMAGLVAGLFGVGGGIVKGPLMLEMGVLPDVAAATSATMIIFTAASASVVYLSFGSIPMDYAVLTFLVGLTFTIIGQAACYWLMRALQRRSVVIFAMALLMVISMVIIYYEAVLSVISSAKEHRLAHFGGICR